MNGSHDAPYSLFNCGLVSIAYVTPSGLTHNYISSCHTLLECMYEQPNGAIHV